MTARKISAQEGALRRGAQAVTGAHGDISASIVRVRAELESLSAVWTGSGALAHQRALATWDMQARRLNQTLIVLEQALRGTERDQAAVELEHSAVITGLGKLMGEGPR